MIDEDQTSNSQPTLVQFETDEDVPDSRSLTPEPPREPRIGDRIGRFVVLSTLGAGAMGLVLAVYDPELDRRAALKLIKPQGGNLIRARERLRREAQALAKLNHGNVVTVYDVGVHDGRVFVAMEYVEGQNLREWLAARPRPRPWPEVLRVFVAAGRGLSAAHQVGLIHRDFKPENVMLGDDGRVRVMDFGLARRHGETTETSDPALDREALAASQSESAALRLTMTGASIGTPAYMAPEQFTGAQATIRSDQFGFCAALYEALYGHRPFAGDGLDELRRAVVRGQLIAPPRSARVPGWLRRVVLRGLSHDPSDRFASMPALLEALRAGQRGRRRRLIAAGLVALALLIGGGVGLRRYEAAARERACVAEGAAIDAVWSDEQRAAVRSGLLATELDYAQTVADKLMPWLDAQAEAWRGSAIEACRRASIEARWEPPTRAKASWCLADRRLELETLIAQLREANAELTGEAVQLAAGLAPVRACVDEAALLAMPASPPASLQPELVELRRELFVALYLGAAGNYEAGLARAREVRARAEPLAWAPLTAAARAREAALLAKLGDLEGAEAAAIDAYLQAARHGSWDLAAAAATDLATNVGRHQARPIEGRPWADYAAAVAIAHAGDPLGLREADRLLALADVEVAAGDYPQARLLTERALASYVATFGPEHPTVAGARTRLASVEVQLGNYAEAIAALAQASTTLERALGPEHPRLAAVYSARGRAEARNKQHEAARASFERALAINRRTLGPDHAEVAGGLLNLGNVLTALGRDAEGLALFEQALAIAERQFGREHPKLPVFLNSLANVLISMEQYERALPYLERALAIGEASVGPDHPELGFYLYNLGNLYSGRDDHQAALASFARAVEIRERSLGADHPLTLATHAKLARELDLLGRTDEARARYEQALRAGEARLGRDAPQLASILHDFGELLEREAELDAARELLERALALREALDEHTAELADTRFALARALATADAPPAQRERARSLATLARDNYRDADEPDELARVERWLSASGFRFP